jgi:hypothetical protein
MINDGCRFELEVLAGSPSKRKSAKNQNVAALVQSFLYPVDYSCINIV